MSGDNSEAFWFDARAKCRVCGRFVAWSAVEPVKYYAASGWNGEVIDGHRSHPQCGEAVEIDVAYRPVRIHDEDDNERDAYFAQIEAMQR